MREKLGPWIPALFCAAVAVITTIGNLWILLLGGSDNSTTMVFILFMPMCFVFAGQILNQLRNENREMRLRLNALDKPEPTTLPNRVV